ncbi:MAG: magnesium/cobalt transporter CorA [Chloroflexales bacterium]|nr:magnesium/cobalt transporter CorA [Chloroflexales bacterium]
MHTLHICQSGVFSAINDLEAISEHLKEPGTVVWLDLEAPDEREVALLCEEFGFHPLAIEDAVRDHERPKVDAYEGYYLFIFYSAGYNSDAHLGDPAQHQTGGPRGEAASHEPQIDLRQLSLFIGKNFIVTIHRRSIKQVAATIARWQVPGSPVGHTVGVILHSLLDAIVDDYFTLMDQIVDWIEELEDIIFSRFRQGAIEEIFGLKKDLLLLRRVVAPERDVLNVLLRQEAQVFKPGELIYMQDVYDHLVRVTDSVDTYRDLLSSALDSYLSLQSNQLNQLVKTLTLSSIILMACALIAGIYGMNFAYMPELAWPWGYPFALGLMLVTGGGLALIFRSRKWW